MVAVGQRGGALEEVDGALTVGLLQVHMHRVLVRHCCSHACTDSGTALKYICRGAK